MQKVHTMALSTPDCAQSHYLDVAKLSSDISNLVCGVDLKLLPALRNQGTDFISVSGNAGRRHCGRLLRYFIFRYRTKLQRSSDSAVPFCAIEKVPLAFFFVRSRGPRSLRLHVCTKRNRDDVGNRSSPLSREERFD